MKIKHSIFGVLIFIIAALIFFCAMYMLRVHRLRQWYTDAQEYINEQQHTNDIIRAKLQQVSETLKSEIAKMQEKLHYLQIEAPIDPTHDLILQRILDIAPERLAYVFNENIELNPPEYFVFLPNNRILISGEWFCTHFEIHHTIEAIFGFWLWNDEINLELRSYAPFGWDGWRDPWHSPNSHSWVRHHTLETVPVRFYGMGGDWDEIWYNVEDLNGENFAEELAHYAFQRLNRRIVDAWFVGTILYVNLHHNEPMRMSSGTFGEFAMYSTLVSSMASVPGIDALVIMVDGQREATFGGHGATFSDIYLINAPGTWQLKAEEVINISGTWVYTESFDNNNEPHIIYEFTIYPPYIEISDDNTLFARFWETSIHAILVSVGQDAFAITEQVATSEGEQWHPENVILLYDTENGLLHWRISSPSTGEKLMHHIFTRT